MGDRAYEISKGGAELARKCADSFTSPDRICFVAGSVGPTTKSIAVTGGISFDEMAEHYYVQVKGLYDGGADFIFIETVQDTLNLKSAIIAIDRYSKEFGEAIPFAISITIEENGTMLAGQGIEAVYNSVSHRDLLSFGLN